MAAIRSLLNPAPEVSKTPEIELDQSPATKSYYPVCNSAQPTRKKQKICKDAAVYTRGPVKGECRYPPHEYQDAVLEAQHQQFEVYPMGEIADYPRHIPYNSEKKCFFKGTGRDSLEVFQYNFKVPGDDTQYAMLWDYNIGLVRTTPLFKCTGHSKTTPAKMLNRNPGLRDICHSITGGALVAQGYWMPFEAAKAVAATFCWNIRYALTPIFGIDFPSICISPDSEKFGDMIIDPAITKRCAQQAYRYRGLEVESQYASRSSSANSTPLTPDTPTYRRQIKPFGLKAVRPTSSVYSSDAGTDDNYTVASTTPEQSYRSLWTPANTPRSMPRLPSPTSALSRKHAVNSSSSSSLSSPELSPKSRRDIEIDKAYDGDSSEDSTVEDVAQATRKVSLGVPSDEKAAYLLMSLKLRPMGQVECRGKKRRAST